LFTQCIKVFRTFLVICTDYFPKQPSVYIFVLLMGKQAVCCEVRIGPLDAIQMNLISERRAMVQAVSHWSATAEDWVRSRAEPCELYVGQSGSGTVFSPSISVFLVYRYCLLIL